MDDPIAAFVVILVVIAAGGWIARTVKHVRADQRMIIERLGVYNRTCGPGWHPLLPWVERGVVLGLDEVVPGWRGYKEEQLQRKLVKEYYQRPSSSS